MYMKFAIAWTWRPRTLESRTTNLNFDLILVGNWPLVIKAHILVLQNWYIIFFFHLTDISFFDLAASLNSIISKPEGWLQKLKLPSDSTNSSPMYDNCLDTGSILLVFWKENGSQVPLCLRTKFIWPNYLQDTVHCHKSQNFLKHWEVCHIKQGSKLG